jgi:hypothetical protein
MNKQEIQELVDKVKYKDWRFIVGQKDRSLYLQIKFDAPDNYTGIVAEQGCRKFTLSEHMVKTEIYDTVWLAIQRAEIHEAAEQYWVWDDESGKYLLPECPHHSFDAKMEMARNGRTEERQ